MSSWRTRLASAAVLLVLAALAVRAASWLLAPAMPYVIVGGGLAATYLFVIRPRR